MEGRLAFLEAENTDLRAQLVVREAGGKIGHIGEVPPGVPPELYGLGLIVGAPAIFDEMQQVLRSA